MPLNNKTNNKTKGDFGEKIALQYLINKNYLLLEKNYRKRNGEIDLIMQIDNCIVFIEVKHRSNLLLGAPAEAVNETKQTKIRLLAMQYISENEFDLDISFRFDVFEVLGKKIFEINHIENAF